MFCSPGPQTTTCVPPKALKSMLNSAFEYEMGLIDENTCYERVGAEHAFQPFEVREAFEQARDSLQSNGELIAFIRALKNESNGSLKVLQTKLVDWAIFDRIFTSGHAGKRKPDLGFFRYVVEETGYDPHCTNFIDDKKDNVLLARSLGLHGLLFDNAAQVRRTLRNLCGDPFARGNHYLQTNAGNHYSFTENSVQLNENFTQNLVNIVEHPRAWNFFQGQDERGFPCDLDTPSLALTTLRYDSKTVHQVMGEIFDSVMCVNTLALLYSYGRGHELNATVEWVYQVLLNRAYLDGTRYYTTTECFLYFLMRLIERSNIPELESRFRPLLKQCVQERIGRDALALSMRILTCISVGVRSVRDLEALLDLQSEDGGWELGWMYAIPSLRVRVGNRGLTTTLAIKAIQAFELVRYPVTM
ncbi:hypothetical protein C8J56DRAFT_1000581 [Mycena floridula]|nr:hypothetical protein C8J56DRAFT_1000581 [Mycena floridula]